MKHVPYTSCGTAQFRKSKAVFVPSQHSFKMRFQNYLPFFAAGSTLGQLFEPAACRELAQYALNVSSE